jgi:hypothetical protein
MLNTALITILTYADAKLCGSCTYHFVSMQNLEWQSVLLMPCIGKNKTKLHGSILLFTSSGFQFAVDFLGKWVLPACT